MPGRNGNEYSVDPESCVEEENSESEDIEKKLKKSRVACFRCCEIFLSLFLD